MRPIITLITLLTAISGCDTRDLTPIAPCAIYNPNTQVKLDGIGDVDLLFVIDDSRSMKDEQEALGEQIEQMVSTLATGDVDGDGVQDQPAVWSLNVGVVSTNLGGAGAAEEDGACAASDGGQLLARHAFDPATDDAAGFAEAVVDSAVIGIEGCNVEQPLEAARIALTEGDFLRDDSVAAVVLLTDEDDCSGGGDLDFGDNFGTTCAANAASLYPVERFVEDLRGLRDDPSKLVFAAIIGVEDDATVTDFGGLVDGATTSLATAGDLDEEASSVPQICSNGSVDHRGREGGAEPAPRILTVAKELDEAGAQVVVDSICAESYAGVIDDITRRIGDALAYSCIARPMHADATGLVTCEVLEKLPTTGDVTRCEQLADQGRVFSHLEDGAEVCTVTQVTEAGEGAGWLYQDGTEGVQRACGDDGQAVAFTLGAEATRDAVLRIECAIKHEYDGHESDVPEIGSACRTDADCGDMVCDPESLTCQAGCETDADCEASHVCHPRGDGGVTICVNPTCEYAF